MGIGFVSGLDYGVTGLRGFSNEYAENPPQIGEEGLEYNVSCQGLNRLKHPQKIQRRREMQFEHFTCMLIKYPEKSNADAKFVLTKSSVLLKLHTKLRSFLSFRPKAREKIQRRRKMHFDQKNRAIHPNLHRHAVFAKSYSSITTTISFD